MKLGIVISTNTTSFSAVSHSTDLEQSIRQSAEMGYDGIEFAVRNPALINSVRLEKYIRTAGLEVPAIGTGQAFLEEGMSFTDRRKKVREDAVERIKSHINFAARFKAGVIIGLIRGRGNEKPRDANGFLAESLAKCADYALKNDVELFIEPLNRYETGLINTVDDAIHIINKLKYKNLKLLIDTFHMNIEEVSLYGSIVRASPYLGHMHFADSNRRPPGSGHIGFIDIVGVLKGLGYDRYLSMEMLPWPTPDKAARMSINHIKGIMKKERSPYE